MGFFSKLVKGAGKVLGLAANLLTGGAQEKQSIVLQGFLPPTGTTVNIPGVGTASTGTNSSGQSSGEWYKQPAVMIGGAVALLLFLFMLVMSFNKSK